MFTEANPDQPNILDVGIFFLVCTYTSRYNELDIRARGPSKVALRSDAQGGQERLPG